MNVEGRRTVLEALRAGREISQVLLASGARSAKILDEIEQEASRRGIPVRRVPPSEIARIARTRSPQGAVALTSETPSADLDEVLERAAAPALLVALDGLTDPHNVGAIARSAEAAGAHAILMPERRSAPITPTVRKTAAGALEHLPVVRVPNLSGALERLKKRGVWVVALDGGAEATIYELPLASEPLCLVVGAEGTGVSRLVRERADERVRIPMSGRIESLNAAAAAAVALFEVRRRREGR